MTRKTDKPEVKLGLFERRYTYDEIRAGSKTGETLMAFDEETLEFVVVKRPSLSQPNPDLRRASIADLEREERALRVDGIRDHPAVCRLLEAGDAEGREGRYRYLVLARARGTPVPALIQQYHEQGQAFPERLHLNITQQLLDLLAAAHRAGVVYNDVKADHLFWDEKAERLTVIDWGNAQFAAEGAATPADDVFQCGELLYEFVTGEKHTPTALLEWSAAGRPAWEAKFRQPVEPALARVVAKALHPDPAWRYPSAGEMAADLETYNYSRDRSPHSGRTDVEPRALWRRLDKPVFATQCDRLAEALDSGTVDAATLRSLWEVVAQAAGGGAERQWVEYYRDLSEAYVALAAGDLQAAEERLRLCAASPVRDRRWDVAQSFCQTAQALVRGDENAARQAYAALTNRHAVDGMLLARRYAESLETLPRLRAALELFTAHPAQAWPQLEAAPPLLRSGALDKALACSHVTQTGFDRWWAGDFPGAFEAFAQAGAEAADLPSCLGAPLHSASEPLERYKAKVRACGDELDGLLAYVKERRGLRQPLLASVVRERLGRLEQRMRPFAGRATDSSRPEVWMQVFDDLVRLRQAGGDPAELMTCLRERGITEQEAIYPLFRAVIAAGEAEAPPAVSRTAERKRRHVRLTHGRYPGWIIITAAVTLVLVAGLAIPFFASLNRREAAPSVPVAGLAPTILPSAPPSPVATTDRAQEACAAIAKAEQAQDWQAVVDRAAALAGLGDSSAAACGNRTPAQVEAQAYYQLGTEAYSAGSFSTAMQRWATARASGLPTGIPIDLLIGCATARAEGRAASFESLVNAFGAGDIKAVCGFDPASYLPVQAAEPVEIDLLSAMDSKRMILHAACNHASCPALYQDESQQWHLNTFFENAEAYLPLDAAFQARSTEQPWADRLRGIQLEFSITSSQPNSFPYQSQIGIEIEAANGQAVRLLLTSEPVLSAAASVVVPGSGDAACEVEAGGPYVIIGENGEFKRHTLAFSWDAVEKAMQLFLDDRPVCRQPIAFPAPLQAALYLSGRGTNLSISRLAVAVASP